MIYMYHIYIKQFFFNEQKVGMLLQKEQIQEEYIYTINPVIYAVILFMRIMRVVVRAHK